VFLFISCIIVGSLVVSLPAVSGMRSAIYSAKYELAFSK